MGKLVLISVIIATVAIPMFHARHPVETVGLRRTILSMVVFNLLYVVAVMYVYPRL